MRRGVAANHIVFGEGLATLAGDALQAEAFATLLNSDLPDGTASRWHGFWQERPALRDLPRTGPGFGRGGRRAHAGSADGRSSRQNRHALMASAQLGVLAAGGAPTGCRRKITRAHLACFSDPRRHLDYTSSAEVLGKRAGSDSARDKTTFMTLMSLQEARRIVGEQTRYAIEALKKSL